MRAYKFRSPAQLPFALDIIFNQQLYCADWSTLNDPMEGRFVYGSRAGASDPKERIAAIIRKKQQLRVCSLSMTFDCHLLWAHYASGFEGLAIEVELPDDSPIVKPVMYRGVFAYVADGAFSNAAAVATQVLTSKYNEWSYEKEVRILQRDSIYTLASPVRRVIAGHRMNPALFTTLRIVCERLGIPICRTGIGDEGIDADNVLALHDDPDVRLPVATAKV